MSAKYYGAVKALIFRDDKFLIIKRSLAARGDPYSWEFPGGRIEFKEPPEEAVVREVQEETSLHIDSLFPISAWTFMKKEDTQIFGVTFLCSEQQPTDVVLSREHDQFLWITDSEVGNYKFSPGVADEIKGWDWNLIKTIKGYKNRLASRERS